MTTRCVGPTPVSRSHKPPLRTASRNGPTRPRTRNLPAGGAGGFGEADALPAEGVSGPRRCRAPPRATLTFSGEVRSAQSIPIDIMKGAGALAIAFDTGRSNLPVGDAAAPQNVPYLPTLPISEALEVDFPIKNHPFGTFTYLISRCARFLHLPTSVTHRGVVPTCVKRDGSRGRGNRDLQVTISPTERSHPRRSEDP